MPLILPGRNQPVPSHGDCSLCDWDTYQETDERAKFLSVLHVVDKHPEAYFEATGKDPAKARFEYAEYLKIFKREL